MLTLLLGTDWIANTDALFELLAKDVADEKKGRILIVPELISHASERRLCADAGDSACRFAEVLSFTRLAKRVAEFVGHAPLMCMDNGGRIVAMASAARQVHSRLKAYASVETKPEFLMGLLDAIDEFKRCCISSDDLYNASQQTDGTLAQKLEELSLLLNAYDAICEYGIKDPRDQMTWLLEELEDSEFAQQHVFYVDGFPDFTRQHMAILVHMIEKSQNVVISLNCDCPNSTMLAFEKVGETAADLLKAAKQSGIETDIRYIPARNDALSTIRESLFQGVIENKIPGEALQLLHAPTPYYECVAAVERILELVHIGARYRDISLVFADPSYMTNLEMILERCHIPAYFSGTEPILGKSVIATVVSAMESALCGFEKKTVIQYLKSPLSPLNIDLTDKLENYVTLWSIDGNDWLKQWQYHPGGLGLDWNEKAIRELEILESARKKAIEPLECLWLAFKSAINMRQQVVALYQFLCAIDLDKRINDLSLELDSRGDNRNAQILNQLWDILMNALEQLHDVLGDTAWESDAFIRLFQLLLSQYDVGTIPTVLDSVAVGPVSAMRCHCAKHLIIAGASEGNLPGYAGSTGVLTDQERTHLRNIGVPLTGGAMDGLKAEFAEIFGVFCGATNSITVSYSCDQPSFIYRRLRLMIDGERATSEFLGAVLSDRVEAGAYFARHNDTASAKQIGIEDEYRFVGESVAHSLGVVSRDGISELYGSTLNLSASQIDKLADCRFHYFMRYGIRAKELIPATVDPAEFGTYVHAVLEKTAREICDLGGFHKVTQEQALEIARKYSSEYATQRFSQLDKERVNYLFNRNAFELELIVKELWNELSASSFEPIGFEVSFGEDCQMPSVNCSGNLLNAQLRGFVDRVDRWVHGHENYFRVVDYKTGKKDFDYCDVFNGLGLQMLLYMFALEQNGSELLGDCSTPAGVQYFPARVPYLSADGQLTDEEAANLRKSTWKRAGLLLCDEGVLEAMATGDESFRLPYKRRKDGTIVGDVANSDQINMLKTYVFRLLGKMVDDIASGKVDPNPYTRGSSHNACTFCPYGSICHKTTVENRRNYQMMSAGEFWEYVQQEVKGHG